MNQLKLSRNYEEEPLKLGEKPTYEDLKYLYLDLNWSREQIAKLIGKSEAQTKKYLAQHKLQKTQAQKLELRKKTTLAKYGVENISQLKEIKEKKEQKALEKYGVKNVFAAKEVQDKIKKVNKERYGTENVAQNANIIAKIQKTNLEKYGVKSVSQADEVKAKIKATNLERYGSEVATKSQEVINKIKATNLEKYGCYNPLQSEEIKNKIKATNLEKYGVEWSCQREDVKSKIKATNLEKYGYSVSSKNEEVKEKAEKTCLEKHGVPYPISNKNIQDKAKQTNLEKYGTEYAAASDIIRAKIKATNLEKYGVESNLSLNESREKAEQTNLERYGFSFPMQNKSIQDKTKQTNLKKYGVENPLQSEEIQRKVKQTNMERYGVEQILSSKSVQDRIRQTNLEKYGTEHPMQNDTVRNSMKMNSLSKYGVGNAKQIPYTEEIRNTLFDPENLKNFILNSEHKTLAFLASKLGVSYSTIERYCHKYDLVHYIDFYTSSYELELQSLFPHMHKTKSAIHPYEIDLYDEERKFGIEFNGNYWHSELKLPINYHQKKSLAAEDAGIFLYHIWEYEWQDSLKREKILSQIKNILGENERKVHARKCYVKTIYKETAEDFINANHMQGYAADSIRLGLYYDTELLAVMTFSKPRFESSCEHELIRYCTKTGTSVIGGASKLFKHFIQEYEPASILSYSHIDKGTGKLYETLGFKLIRISDPDYIWCNGEEVLSRYQCQKHKLKKMGFEGTEREVMEGLGFFRIFGCGNKVWKWTSI